MTLDTCRISSRISGRARDGSRRRAVEGTVREVVRNDSCVYRAVLAHLRACADGCEPADALELLLERRMTPKLLGRTSGELVDLAFEVRREFGKEKVPRDVLKRYVSASMTSSPVSFLNLCDRLLSEPEVVSAFRAEHARVLAEWIRDPSRTTAFGNVLAAEQEMRLRRHRALSRPNARLTLSLCRAFGSGDPSQLPEDDEELLGTMSVLEVMSY